MKLVAPRWLYCGMIAFLAAAISAHYLFGSPVAAIWISFASREAAYAWGTCLCLLVAAEYKRQPLLRMAWLLLAANGLVSIVRHVLESRTLEQWPPVHLWRHATITLALLLLLGGIWAMAQAFVKAGLGFRIHRTDGIAVAMIFGVLCVILVFRDQLSEASMPLPGPRVLQISSQVVIALAAAFSVALHRIIVDMGGGKLAISMRFLVAHILGRVLLVLLSQTFKSQLAFSADTEFAFTLGFDVMTWVFALAAAYRATMFAAALQQAPPRPDQILALQLDQRWAREVSEKL
ncbi:MAG TPA: hypothetical protein VGL53_20540 [Bryobacteraceae bacterium]|jgi:hypothetical protein